MIKSITFEDFLSFSGKVHVDLNPGANLLVGINGSGKSNFIKALRLLQDWFSDEGMGLEESFGKSGGVRQLKNFSVTEKPSFSLEFVFDKEDVNRIEKGFKFESDLHYSLRVIGLSDQGFYWEEALFGTDSQGDRMPYLTFKNGRGEILMRRSDVAMHSRASVLRHSCASSRGTPVPPWCRSERLKRGPEAEAQSASGPRHGVPRDRCTECIATARM